MCLFLLGLAARGCCCSLSFARASNPGAHRTRGPRWPLDSHSAYEIYSKGWGYYCGKERNPDQYAGLTPIDTLDKNCLDVLLCIQKNPRVCRRDSGQGDYVYVDCECDKQASFIDQGQCEDYHQDEYLVQNQCYEYQKAIHSYYLGYADPYAVCACRDDYEKKAVGWLGHENGRTCPQAGDKGAEELRCYD